MQSSAFRPGVILSCHAHEQDNWGLTKKMSNTIFTSTDQFAPKRFTPHGRVEYEDRGRLLWSRAEGPFNAELMGALLRMAMATFPAMAAKGPWANVATFSVSALCSPEVLAGLSDGLRQMVQAGIAPAATAFVLPCEVEGAAIMGALYAKAYADAGLRYAFFANFDSAHDWLESVLGPLGE